ncbi:MAG: hypothetical protein AAFV88_00920 [Planctomycetota bacterium]
MKRNLEKSTGMADEAEQGLFLDRQSEVNIAEGMRPHWMQDGAIVFLTIRLADSLPKDVLEAWDRERLAYLHSIGLYSEHWLDGVRQLSRQQRHAFDRRFRRLKEIELDRCHGECPLRRPELAQIVSDAFRFFDDDRYLMGDYVVMPNHAHCLVVFPDSVSMRRQCTSWTRFTATKINRLLGRRGDFWQEEPFDHLVRSESQLDYLRRYIAENPVKAKLRPGEYLYRRSERKF